MGTTVNACHRRRAESPNDVWCRDFIFDRTESGSQLNRLLVIDKYTRECLALKVDRGVTSSDVIDTLAELFAMRGVPKRIRSDNGPGFIANELRACLGRVGVSALSIDPGSPWETGYAESFNSRFRDEFMPPGSGFPRHANIEWYRKSKPVTGTQMLPPTRRRGRRTATGEGTMRRRGRADVATEPLSADLPADPCQVSFDDEIFDRGP